MASRIQQLIQEEKYDCIIASQADTAGYWRYFCDLPALFEEVEMGVLYEGYIQAKGLKNRVRNGLTWAKHRRYIASLINNFSACTVVSEKEKFLLNEMLPEYRAVEVIPNCINLADYDQNSCQPDPGSIIFTGSFRYFANYNAMLWFIEDVLPIIRANIPGVKLVITGDHANMPLPSSEAITLTGFVDDIRPLIARSCVSIAPILQGGGTRLKILEAMALKTPVVATTKGAEGLDVVEGSNILIGDSAEDFANAVIMVLSDPQLRQRLVENAYKLVQKEYDWSVVMPKFTNLVRRVASQ
jgi:glycosyltransferase involved in cell wall biosynthesis